MAELVLDKETTALEEEDFYLIPSGCLVGLNGCEETEWRMGQPLNGGWVFTFAIRRDCVVTVLRVRFGQGPAADRATRMLILRAGYQVNMHLGTGFLGYSEQRQDEGAPEP